jgi:glycosyltransferase involved in cell wall biosynthesis
VNVLYIASAYNRHDGDVITPWLVRSIEEVQSRGVRVDVLAPSYRGSASHDVGGVRVHRFRYAPGRLEDLTHDQTAPDRIRSRPWYAALVPGYVASASLAAARLVRREGFDLVHVHWPIPHGVIGLAARWATGVPVVSSFHGVELTWTKNDLRLLTPVLRYLIRTSDAVTANSTYTQGLIRGLHDRPVQLIPFGTTVPVHVDPSSLAKPADGPFELLCVGRLVERKGLPVLLDALSLLDTQRHVSLHVVGDGPRRAEWEARAGELGLGGRVHFHGFVSEEQLAVRYASCDAFVLPAVFDSKGDTEGLGVVLIEAASNGKPLIGSAIGGIVDVVKDDVSGIRVRPSEPPALASAIASLMDDPERRGALGEGARRLWEAEFSWAIIADRLVDLYGSLVQGHVRTNKAAGDPDAVGRAETKATTGP